MNGPACRVAAVLVLYRPEWGVLDNVSSLIDQVDILFAVDNTEEPDPDFVAALGGDTNVQYISNGANLGIAAALNIGARAARGCRFSWLLTMDQDSTATPGMVDRLLACALSDTSRIGLVSPVHRQVGGKPRAVPLECHEVLTAMTSGNLVSLAALDKVGGFMEELFIDQVDNELCLRMSRSGYRVVESGDADLVHRVGELRRHRFPYPAYSTNHSALRRYYITRNRLWVGRMYADDHPEFDRFERSGIRKDVVKIILYEPAKYRKLAMMWRGWRDYRAGRLGEFVVR